MTPMEPGSVLMLGDFAEEPMEYMITEMNIGIIGYCATAVRFDISHAVSVLSRRLARPCTKDIDFATSKCICIERGISPSSGCHLLWKRRRDLPT
jgi:hypothetical protein